MSLKDTFITDIPIFLNKNEFADEIADITHSKTILCIKEYLSDPEITSQGSKAQVYLYVNILDMGEIKPMNKLFFDNNTWIIERIELCDEYIAKILCRSSEGFSTNFSTLR